MNVNVKCRCCGALVGLLVSCATFAEPPPEQIQAFFSRVPEWGEPAIKAAQQEAIRQQYEAEVAAAHPYRYAYHHHHHHHHHHHDHGSCYGFAGYGAAEGLNRHCGGDYR
ncbi:hypothetical protein [uncultured Thiodictyon sp.]|uniref:hypothetical protein n=1 Tax=uncultured Thiodictyon sp. TaxID=1846217 RepID=UPI0025EC2973|nr:hypothetical protein [uncultured Thiodictyon sp.]